MESIYRLERFHHAKTVVRAMDTIMLSQSCEPRFVDTEVIPPFDGSPEDIWVWFIVDRSDEIPGFQENCFEDSMVLLKQELRLLGFPENALETLRGNVTSREDIQNAGGRFAYFH